MSDGFQTTRLILEFVLWLVVIRYSHMIWLYVRVIWPLRRQIDERAVIAPPARTTLIYHLTVAYMIVVQAGGTLYGLRHSLAYNPFVLALLPGQIVLFFAVDAFARSYASRLRNSARNNAQNNSQADIDGRP